MGATKTKGAAIARAKTTAEEIFERLAQQQARRDADAQFYASAVQRMAAGEVSDSDIEAAELIAAELGHNVQRDVDQLKKLARWQSEGYLASDDPGFTAKHDALFAKRQELVKERDELTAKVSKAHIDADRAEFDRRKFYDFGLGMKSMRERLAHVLGGQAQSN
jgi:hypothetical protein